MANNFLWILALSAYWLIFWQKFIHNPYLLCTSEVASTFFPHWRWMGQQLRQGIFPAQDNIYYKLPGSIPFLATFYPPNLLTAWLGSWLNEDKAFRLYAYFIILHFLLCSIFAYHLFGNLFCAITLTYAGYVIKPNTPTFVYSATWFPLAMQGGVLGAVGWMMALYGGYYPILVYVAPLLLILHPEAFILGSLLALPQILPFLGYFKRSIRMKEKVDRNFGRVPAWKLLDLVIPQIKRVVTNGVHYPEMMMYMGIAILLLSWDLVGNLGILAALLIILGVVPSVQRIPARSLYLLTLCICLSLKGEFSLSLTSLQTFLLLKNASIYPSFPFAQWWHKPSVLYTRKPKQYNWPYLTGYLEGRKISDYHGAFRLKD